MSSYLELIKESVKIVDYIGRYVNLKHKGGGEYQGLCPLHTEKTPSFTVSATKSFFHCFGCNNNGDVIAFAAQYYKLSYKEAMKRLIEEYNIIIPKREENWRAKRCAEIHQALAEYYHRTLFLNSGKMGLEYLKKRGVTEDLCFQYKLGWCDAESKKWLLQHFALEDLLTFRVLMQKNNYIYNSFQNRIIFPIKWLNTIVAFGGRSINPELKPKYLNSNDNILFHKGKILYGLYKDLDTKPHQDTSYYTTSSSYSKESVNKEILEQKTDLFSTLNNGTSVIVVEGYMDVLAMTKAGFQAVVAPLGTGMTLEQINILWQKFKKIIICFDSDIAGQNAMYRIANLVWKYLTPDKSITFTILEDGKDPDEILTLKGVNILATSLNNSQHIVDFIFLKLLAEYDLSNIEARAAFRDRLRKMTIQHRDLHFEYQKELSQKLWNITSKARNKDKIALANQSNSTYVVQGSKRSVQVGKLNSSASCSYIPYISNTNNSHAHYLLAFIKTLMTQVPSERLEEIASLDIKDENIALIRDIIIDEANKSSKLLTVELLLEQIKLHHLPINDLEGIKKTLNAVKNFSLLELKADNIVGIIDRCILLHNLFSLQDQIKQVSDMLLAHPSIELERRLLALKKDELQLQMSISRL